MLYFITGNTNKFKEFQAILWADTVQQIDIDLPELQEIDPHKIIEHKIREALKHHQGPLIIEDTSLYFECLGGKLPWPLIKRFLKELNNEWLHKLAENHNNFNAKATVLIWYAENKDKIEFFEWTVEGTIVKPVQTDFWWDAIFQPNGYSIPYWAMEKEEKNKISMRRMALNKLKDFLENK